jgi:hypothetical protein
VSAWSRCEGTIRFRFVPLLVTGEGKRTPFTVESVYERRPEYAPPTTLQNPSDVYCVGMKHAERLAPGKWRVDIDVTSWSPNPRYPEPFAPWALSCRMTVVQGKPESLPNILGNNLRTTFGRDRCGRGDTWPW